MSNPRVRLSREQRTAYNDLKAAHAQARAAIESAVYGPTDREVLQEQDAYDALIDFVDAHKLTYTTLDPRGTLEEYEEAVRQAESP